MIMKKIIYSIISICLFSFISCDDEDNYLKINDKNTTASEFTFNCKEGIVAQTGNLTDSIGKCKWTTTSFGYDSPITYAIEMSIDESFSTIANVGNYSTSGQIEKVTIETLNTPAQKFLAENAKPSDMQPTKFYIRVKATLGTVGLMSPLYSNVVSVTFTPIPLPKVKPLLYIIGNSLIGWDNSVAQIGNELQLFFAEDSKINNQKYTYTGIFNPGEGLKFPVKAGDWDTAYGYTSSLVSNGGGNMPGPAEQGIYTLDVDLTALTATLTPYTGAVRDYTTIGIVGDAAKGWPDESNITDIEMIRTAGYVWIARNVELKVGNLKFRADKEWGASWGAGKTQQFPFDGNGDENIVIVEPGKYFIALNSLTGHHIIILESDLPVK